MRTHTQLSHCIRICTASWTVLGLDQPLCGDVETWEMSRWSEMLQGWVGEWVVVVRYLVADARRHVFTAGRDL